MTIECHVIMIIIKIYIDEIRPWKFNVRFNLQWGFILRRCQCLRLFIICGRIVDERLIVKDLEGSGRGVIKEVSWYFPSVTCKICETSHSNVCS
jgi:hypothetical protein